MTGGRHDTAYAMADPGQAGPAVGHEQGVKRALVYLRVSTPSQVNTDYDPEGISIPAQREACDRKAAELGIEILDEYVEPGRSATSMDKRPVFQAMLERIKSQRDVDFVIVYELSRMNRNRIDDALVLMSLRQYKVALISATENIDDTPVGQLTHGILAAFNEFRSAKDGADIKYKMGEKAKRGGTLGRARLGYLNVREIFEGREVRTVALDPDRASFVLQGFELYATGDYSFQRLADTLTERGLRTRPGRYGSRPVSDSKIAAMLRDRYYCGYVTYQGVEYKGRHPELVSEALFDKVQQVLDTRQSSGERRRRHHHYLKGTVWCGHCHDRGEEHRLIVQRAVGRAGGVYFYFFCRGRQEGRCVSHYLNVEDVEDAVVRHYRRLKLTPDFIDLIRAKVDETLADQHGAARLAHKQLTTQLAKLDRQEENLLDLTEAGSLPSPKVRSRLNRISRERETAQRELASVDNKLEVGAQLYETALRLLEDPHQLYEQASSPQRRLLNQAFFEKLYIDEGEVVSEVLTEPFRELVEAHRMTFGGGNETGDLPDAGEVASQTKAGLLMATFSVGGSSKAAMVELRGFEPLTSCMPCKRSTN